jgi:rhamnose utilization protein RhaD (predicted bifunctional aldolase and dehydrogenase)/NAD(P)-dependent dehydrogenase (short-subunit alcohol dehydrogenase family)
MVEFRAQQNPEHHTKSVGDILMRNQWNDHEASNYSGDLALRVYTSRLLGREATLVLHGGGNTSVKIREKNVLGDEHELLYVKGSGWDLETIEAAGFAPVRMDHLLRLAALPTLSDPQMVNELKTHTSKAGAPTPSVETILHATLPHKYVDHTHADAIVAITNTGDGEARIREIFGDSVVVVPYVMPGFDLARLCAEEFARQSHPGVQGMVLLKHGIFSFGATARQSYERMIQLVTKAEAYLENQGAWNLPPPRATAARTALRIATATLRRDIAAVAGWPVVLRSCRDEGSLAFAQHPEVASLSQQGPATPDHVIRTKPVPLLGRDVQAFAQRYREYFARHAPRAKQPKTILDCAPRVVLDPELGLSCVGRTAKDATIVADIYQHTIEVILRADALGGYEALPENDIFDMEYWDLEQAKLKSSGNAPLFAGEVVLITGAASGIGKACVSSFLRRGAAVIGLDINAAVASLHDRPDYLGITADVTDAAQRERVLELGIERFGGLDMLVLNAGVFPGGCRIDSLSDEVWRRVLSINLDANLALLRETYPLLKLAPRNGRVVVIGSKNVPAPGPGAAAYSASKAALNQLARIAALEWAKDGIRINSLHPDAVFDTAIWTDEVLQTRAAHYGLSVEQYKRKNLLGVPVASADVAELAAEMCGPLFAKTTGAQLPVDGGNERVI